MVRGESADELLGRFTFSSTKSPASTSPPPETEDNSGEQRYLSLAASAFHVANHSTPNLPSAVRAGASPLGPRRVLDLGDDDDVDEPVGMDGGENNVEESVRDGGDVCAHGQTKPVLAPVEKRTRLDVPSMCQQPPRPSILSPQHSFLLSTTLSPMSPYASQNPLDDALLSLNLAMFWQWTLCFCLVNFDLELGQALERVYPPIDFSEDEKRTIAFSAFPDSNSSAHSGDSTFAFRMRSGDFTQQLYLTQQLPPFSVPLPNSSGSGSRGRTRSALPNPGAGLPVDTDGYTYGYVFFRQKRDVEIRRGFFQKSLVVLTPHPWPGLFLHLVKILGPKYMDALVDDRKRRSSVVHPQGHSSAKSLLEAACFNIAA
ncbi:hypothetical protein HK104_007184, partial [Borealophlyctis nickersoniae]